MRNTGILKVIVLMASLAVLAGCGPASEDPNPADPNTGADPGTGSKGTSNQKPIAIITPDNEQNVTVGEKLFFNGFRSFDPDSITPLSYRWSLTGAATSIRTFNNVTPGGIYFTEAGTVTVSLVVTDNLGLESDVTSVVVNVYAAGVNRPPDGFISHDNGTGETGSTGNLTITTGASVEFTGSASDPEGDPVSYNWNIPANVTAPTVPGSQPFTARFPVAGTYVISLIVSDNNGNVDPTPAQVTVTVTDASTPINLPPKGSISHDNGTGATGSTGNITIAAGTNVVFQGSANDPENDPVTYTWNIPANVTAPTTPGSQPFTASFTVAGTYVISLIVSDNVGNVDPTPAQVVVTVTDPGTPVNLPPNGSISHDNGTGASGSTGDITVTVGTSVVFQGSASDPDNDPITYTWNIPSNVTAPTAPGSQPFTATFNVSGTYVISLAVSDNAGNADPTPAQVVVNVTDPNTPVNLPPNGSISHDNGTGATGSTGDITIAAGTNVVFQGSASDPENDPVTYTWNIPTNVTAPAAPGSQPFTATFGVAGSYVISLTVSDDAGNVDPTPAQIVVTVTPNLPPNGFISHDNGTGAIGSTGDINIISGTTVVFNGSASDPENDPVSYAWIFDGATASSTTGAGPISVSYTTPGSFLVQLTVTDSIGNSDPSPAELTVNVSLPEFKYLPVLNDEDGNPNDGSATYNLSVDDNVAVDVVTLTGSWTTPMMRYNGLQLPPVIVARRGTQMTFNVDNNLAEETTIHWHGFKIPAAEDGGPDMPIAVGGSRTYSFTMAQPAGPLWFHPHAHGTTATQVYNGLAGAFIVTDNITDNLENNNQIPSGDQDIALLLQDRRFAADNGTGVRPLIYQAGGGMMGMLGMLGDRILVNGVEMPGLDVATRKYRFRIYNGSNARTYDVALDNGANFTVIGTDGGLLNSPVVTDHIMLSSGERAEIVVDFGNYAVGDNVMLVSRAFPGGGMMGGGTLANGDPFNIMQFQVTAQFTDNVVLYTSLPATADINTRLNEANATATRSFEMNVQPGGMGVGMQFTINGQLFDINRVDELVASGATEVWSITNASPMAHPFHAHAIQWQVLDRDGNAANGVDLGWKDTVLVQSGETVRIIGRFDPVINVGKYMYHCHILEHEEAGMMGIFEVQAAP